jgi:hypothetical protein
MAEQNEGVNGRSLRAFLRETSKQPKNCFPMEVVVDGKVVGEVKPSKYRDNPISWMASFNLSRIGGMISAYGHGDTPAKAIADAIANGHAELDMAQIKLAELEEQLYGSAAKDGTPCA